MADNCAVLVTRGRLTRDNLYATGRKIASPVLLIMPSADTWSDDGYVLHVDCLLLVGDRSYELRSGRLLIDGVKNTSREILRKCEVFRLPTLIKKFFSNQSFLFSLADEKDYKTIFENLGVHLAKKLMLKANDAGFLRIFRPDSKDFIRMSQDEAYKRALFRSIDAFKLSLSIHSFFDRKYAPGAIPEEVFAYVKTILPYGQEIGLDLDFSQTPFGRSRINILIGENGLGKTEILRSMIRTAEMGANHPVDSDQEILAQSDLSCFNRVIFIPSALDMDEAPLRDPSSQGVRLASPLSKDGARKITSSLANILRETNHGHSATNNWAILQRVLTEFIDLRHLFLPVSANRQLAKVTRLVRGGRYLSISHFLNVAASDSILLFIDESRPVLFLDQNCENIRLSSGQNAFFSLATALTENITFGSLVLIDEPELSLHPQMIASLITFLNEMLVLKDSFAVLATHSLHLIREVDRECVHVLKKDHQGILTDFTPFMQTFGADLSMLSEVVFSGSEINELFEQKIIELASKSQHDSQKKARDEVLYYLGADGISFFDEIASKKIL